MILECTIGFFIFCFLQALFINGVHYCFQGGCVNDIKDGKVCKGEIFYKMAPRFFERNKNKTWFKPIGGCIKCMASVWGTITFWSVVKSAAICLAISKCLGIYQY